MSRDATEWFNPYRLNGTMASRDPLCLLSLEDWEKRAAEAQAVVDADPELKKARCRLEERQKRVEREGKQKKEKDSFEAHLRKTTQLIFSSSRQMPTLCEPRNLYSFKPQLLGAPVPPRWPNEVSCIPDPISHSPYVPKHRELLHKPDNDGHVPQHGNGGRLVYFYPPCSEPYFKRSRVGESVASEGSMCCKLESSSDYTLLFESRFESGNLQKAVQVRPFEYELWLRCDLYTQKHTQWYYFRVQNMRPGVTYKFTIMNLLKPDSLYNHGMKVLMYSEKKATQKKIGWHRVGHHIRYYKNNLRREDGKADQFCYSLTWQSEFPYMDDVCYFAHCYPYTYSDLQEYLQKLSQDTIRSQICKQRILCRTIAGNLVHVLTITSFAGSPVEAEAKRAIVVTARVHPGETNASWMMKGLLDFLTGSSRDAKILRDNFVFKIIPMLNPDGVIVGNYRCSLAGRDLNRNYRTNLKDSFPTVWYTKQMVKRLTQEREVVLYCDFHGHSRKQNVFIYGCDNKTDPSMRLHERVFPMMLQKNAPTKFSFSDCSFKVQKSKEGTGRIVMWREMGIMNSYTMEATFCGSTLDKTSKYHFSTADLEAMGYHFCDTLLDYCDPDRSKYEVVLHEVEEKVKAEILAKLAAMGKSLPPDTDPLDVPLLDSDFSSGAESSDAGSDSSVSDGLPVHMLHGIRRIGESKGKKKKRKSRTERNRRRSKLKLYHRSGNEQTTDRHQAVNGPSFVPLTERDIITEARTAKMPSKTRHERKEAMLRLTTVEHERIPTNTEERLEDRNLRRLEYLESLTDDYIRSGVHSASANPSTSKLKGSGARLAGLVQDRLSGNVMISGYSLTERTESTQPGSRAIHPARAASPPRIGSLFGHHVAAESPRRTNSQGPGAFTARYVSHHLASESGVRLLPASRVQSAGYGSSSSRPTTARRSLASLSQFSSSRSGTTVHTVLREPARPRFHVSDIVRRRDVPLNETTAFQTIHNVRKTGNEAKATGSACTIASAVTLDKSGIQTLAEQMADVDGLPVPLHTTSTASLVGSRVFKKQLQAVQTINMHGSSSSSPRPARHDLKKDNDVLPRASSKPRLSPISQKPATSSHCENGAQSGVSASLPVGTDRHAQFMSAVAREKAKNPGRIEEHKTAIAAAVREREEIQRQSLTNIKEASSKISRTAHFKVVETEAKTETVGKDKKGASASRGHTIRDSRNVRKTVSEPTPASRTDDVRKIAKSAAPASRNRHEPDAEVRRPVTVHGVGNPVGKNEFRDGRPVTRALAFVDGNELVTLPTDAGARLTFRKYEAHTSPEALSSEPLEPPVMYKVGPKPTAETGTPTPTIDLTIEEVNLKRLKSRKTQQGRPYLRPSHASRMVSNAQRQRDGEG